MSIEVGSKLEGKVTGITNFGAFIELPEGVTGLVHISEIADNYVKDVNDFLKINDMVTVKVINVEKDGKIGLSIRKAQERPVEDLQSAPKKPDQKRFERGDRPSRPPGSGRPTGKSFSSSDKRPKSGGKPIATFDDKVSKFLKDSEDRLSSLKRNTESKRGGRGARKG